MRWQQLCVLDSLIMQETAQAPRDEAGVFSVERGMRTQGDVV